MRGGRGGTEGLDAFGVPVQAQSEWNTEQTTAAEAEAGRDQGLLLSLLMRPRQREGDEEEAVLDKGRGLREEERTRRGVGREERRNAWEDGL